MATVLSFGKYRGQALEQVVFTDRGYVEWVAREIRNPALRNAAQAILAATRLVLTDEDRADWAQEDAAAEADLAAAAAQDQAELRRQVVALLDRRHYPAAKRPAVLAQAATRLRQADWRDDAQAAVAAIVTGLGAALAQAGYR